MGGYRKVDYSLRGVDTSKEKSKDCLPGSFRVVQRKQLIEGDVGIDGPMHIIAHDGNEDDPWRRPFPSYLCDRACEL